MDENEEVQIDSNCIGYAFYCLGLQKEDQYIEPADLTSYEERFNIKFIEAPLKHAHIIAALRGNDPYIDVLHLAVLDPDGLHVTHRPNYRQKVVNHTPIEEAFAVYQEHSARIAGLKIERVKR